MFFIQQKTTGKVSLDKNNTLKITLLKPGIFITLEKTKVFMIRQKLQIKNSLATAHYLSGVRGLKYLQKVI